MAIKPAALIEKFKYALDNKWGYIWGRAGILWTEALQRNVTGEQAQKYGAKWIGHRVADCSGLFSWAFKQLGGYMYHGSNTMYNKYCTAKGQFSRGKRTDGQELKPGTALFTGSSTDRGHVGLYIGNGEVIEAQGTINGVVLSKSTLAKWTWWGELKGVDYSVTATKTSGTTSGGGGSNPATTAKMAHKTLRKGAKGDEVKTMQSLLAKDGSELTIDGIFGSGTLYALKAFQRRHGLAVDGICGPKTWAELEKIAGNAA